MSAPNKLTEEQRIEMHRLWKYELKAVTELAKVYNISVPMANRTITKIDERSLKNRNLIWIELEKIQTIKSNTGKDSTIEEIKEAKLKEAECVNRINKIDPEYFVKIKPDND